MTVLKSLAKLDPASPHWEVDVLEMERARLREIDGESRSAAKEGDSTTLKSLLAEITAPGWREPVPSTLTRDVKSRTSQTIRTNAKRRLTELAVELYSAFSALDLETARPLRDEWVKLQEIAVLSHEDPLAEQVAPILGWLDDEDRKRTDERAYAKIVAEVERALDNDELDPDELKRLKRSVEQLDRSLPHTVEMRFRSRWQQQDYRSIGGVDSSCWPPRAPLW